MPRVKGQGRRKTVLERIESKSARQVCFSKRRSGLFKKAHEMSVICGAHVAAIAFSPAGRPFSFGSPSVEAVIDRLYSNLKNLDDVQQQHSTTSQIPAGRHEPNSRSVGGQVLLDEAGIENLGLEELLELEKQLEAKREDIQSALNFVHIEAAHYLSQQQQQQQFINNEGYIYNNNSHAPYFDSSNNY